METINNIAGVASKAIWGDANANAEKSGTEPVSGKQGAGTTNEPYDKGNEETNTETNGSTIGTSDHNIAPDAGVDTSAENRSGPSEATSGPETGDPKSGQKPEAKQQGADKPGDEPTDNKNGVKMPHSDEEREKLVMTGNFPHDPNDHSGEPLQMHGGSKNADSTDDTKDEAENTSSVKKDRSASVAHEGGGIHGKEEGTGTKVIKASGLAADGGDFDATKPGAGSEATRLLEQKGIHKSGDNHGAPEATEDTTSSETPGKTSKIAKIKEKLHIGSK